MAKPRSPLVKWLTRHVAHPLETALVRLAVAMFRARTPERASDLGARIGRTLGPRLPSHRTARRNLERAFPEKSAAGIDAILTGMWDNLGRTIGEYAHLDALAERNTEVVGGEILEAMRSDGRGGILVSGHLANWEVPPVASRKHGLELALVYRAPNNPDVGDLLVALRGAGSSTHIPKGPAGARTLVRLLSEGGHVAILIDQKLNDGIPVRFFGRDAMTAPAAATFALRLGIPIAPARMERLGGARFRITVFPPLDPPNTGDRAADARILTERLTALLESWIRERPEQWLWTHRRWPD
ncbi:lauroyl acyltransferase [Azospirillum sp. TSO22-1]|uniref:LpxL/LpxP family acyltransferase n=1 Tax=Azospirillum sp. TSO22-1 TaxID=716789 RepID=UPI000D60BF40|nr:lauroyl acyltransferase [Azospirillum sp. TSO22-1]PWC40686.1 lauroyl acyltransferase [Azospirillum sp. TSO22-1]